MNLLTLFKPKPKKSLEEIRSIRRTMLAMMGGAPKSVLFTSSFLKEFSTPNIMQQGTIDINKNVTYFANVEEARKWYNKFIEPDKTLKHGGIIVFKTHCNIEQSDLLGFIKKFDFSNNIGFGMGNLCIGRFTRDNNLFDERSLSIEIVGINSDKLKEIGNYLREQFNQFSVLIKDNATREVGFILE